MKKYSKAELQEMGQKVANENQETEYIATEDGQFFLPKNKSAAAVHCKAAKLQSYELKFELEAPVSTVSKKEMNVQETSEKIQECETLEALEAFASDTRKGVQKAYKAMKVVLEEEAAVLEAQAHTDADQGTAEGSEVTTEEVVEEGKAASKKTVKKAASK